jgi:glycosyltransferase involved in cell wall biosynthesis
MRLILITEMWRPSLNGVVTRLEETVRVLRAHGHQVLVVCPRGLTDPAPLAGVALVEAPSFRLGPIYGGQPWGFPTTLGLRRRLDAFRADLVHVVNPVILGLAGVAYARSRHLPLVCSYHTHVVNYARFYHLGPVTWFIEAEIRRAHRRADLNLVTADASAVVLRRWGAEPVRLWRGAADLTRFGPRHATRAMRERLTGGHPDREIVLYTGRLATEKGLPRLYHLAAGKRHLALVGDGPARQELEEAAAGRQITFTGRLDGEVLAQAYASADVFCFPSVTDTLGLVMLEAMASGLPVVAARTEGSQRLLVGVPHTALVDAEQPAAWARAVDRLLAQPGDRGQIATAAQLRTPTWVDATGDLLAAYAEVLPPAAGLADLPA